MDSSGMEESLTPYENDDPDEISPSSPQKTIEYVEKTELKDENSEISLKPSFKNTLQAKKRLQAYAQQKQILTPPSAKTKFEVSNENPPHGQSESQESPIVATKPKKENPMDKAKATVEEIELLKKSDFSCTLQKKNEERLTQRSRSRSSERDFVFRKRERKVRNYRRSDNSRRSPSPTPTITAAKEKYPDKSKQKYPRNWNEFVQDNWTFEQLISKDSHFKSKSSNTPNDIFRQLLFDSPSESIKPYQPMKNRANDKTIPYKFLRYTLTKPKIAYNENMIKIKEPYLNRKQVLDRTQKNYKVILEKFFSRNTKKFKTSEPMGQRNWYLKNWRDTDSKVLETSIGLSFLQNYSDDDEEEDTPFVESNNLNRSKGKISEDKFEVNSKTSNISTKDRHITEKSPSISGKNRRKSESKSKDRDPDEVTSWTPERKVVVPSAEVWKESPEINKEKEAIDEKRLKKCTEKYPGDISEDNKLKPVPSDDEGAETSDRNVQYSNKDKKKKKKLKKSEHENDDSSSSSELSKLKKKKKKLARKKKQREKEKKAKKKEKLKAEKLKEKKKQKEKEKKEIMKRLKKEFQQNVGGEEREAKEKTDVLVDVKIEKEDENEKVLKPSEDSKKCLIQKEEKSHQKISEILEDKKCKVHQADMKTNMEKLFDAKKEEQLLQELVEPIKKIGDLMESSKLPLKNSDEAKPKKKAQNNELDGGVTPDTEEYQSNWESDDGISPIIKPGSKKLTRGWESDEEVFDRAFSKRKPGDISFGPSAVLEIPLDIKFPKRSFNRQEKKRSRTRSPEYLDMEKEIKLLEAERINLNKERMQLEMEKIRIHELERKKSLEEMEHGGRKALSPWRKNRENKKPMKDGSIDSTLKEISSKEERYLKNKDKSTEKAKESMNTGKPISDTVLSIHSSPEITSTKSPTHMILESAYQEFMRAVSGGNKTNDIVISSAESDVQIQEDSSCRTKVKLSRSLRDKKREKNVEIVEEKKEQVMLSTTDPKILQEILLPGEIPMPEVVAVPVPVPSPKLDSSQKLAPAEEKTITHCALVKAPPVEEKDVQESENNQQVSLEGSPSKKPFTFSTLVIPSKKSLLLERSNWKLDESDEELPSKMMKIEDIKLEGDLPEQAVDDQLKETKVIEKQVSKRFDESISEKVRIEKVADRETVEKKENETSVKRKYSRSRSPSDVSRDKRRREDDIKRRNDERRRDSGSRREDYRKREEESKRKDRSKRPISPSRPRDSSPRRRRYSSPVHRRSSPRHRDSRRSDRGERRSSPSSKRRRSYSPTKPSPAPRKRSPSPRETSRYSRMSKSPRRSPMEGLKRSVADSTISDDLLPQNYAVDSSSSPLCSSTPAPSSRRLRLTLSPKRPSLDERINQVLGIEAESQPPPQKSLDPRQNSLYSSYHHTDMSTDLRHSSSVSATPSKVLQVGNIIQVVPSEDFGQPLPQPVQPPPVQKILQVGNMLQIVPSDMDLLTIPIPEPPKQSPLPEKVCEIPERRSAENVLDDRMADRVKKRLEKEERKMEKERKKKEKDKKKKMRLKVSTEEMIKRALELDGYIGSENEDLNAMVPEIITNTPGLDSSRSILSKSSSRFLECSLKTEKERKSVQFADGVRPGEGTSPSGGEELSSPPPRSDVLMKPKKYKRIGSFKKKKKRKIKVKVVKKRPAPPPSPTESDEEYENLPPPSPPPGSPPPHVFPPRAKVHTINNIPQHYLSSYGITTAPQTPPVVQPQSRMNLAYQTPPTAIYRTPPPHVNVIGQHFPRMSHAPPMGMNVPPPPSPIHRDQPPYGTF